MSGGNDEDPGFWPGYVAATAGLVQGLLIVSMALGVSIFGLGQLAELEIENQNQAADSKVLASQIKAAAEDEPAYLVLSGQGGNLASISASILASQPLSMDEQSADTSQQVEPIEPVESAPEPLGLDSVPEQEEKEWEAPAKAGRSINVAFVSDAVTIPDSSAEEIRAAIQQDSMSGATSWRVFVPADVNDPRSVRAGYLRLIALRQALMDAGVSGDGIELKIRDEKIAEDDLALAELVPIGADNEPLRDTGGSE